MLGKFLTNNVNFCFLPDFNHLLFLHKFLTILHTHTFNFLQLLPSFSNKLNLGKLLHLIQKLLINFVTTNLNQLALIQHNLIPLNSTIKIQLIINPHLH